MPSENQLELGFLTSNARLFAIFITSLFLLPSILGAGCFSDRLLLTGLHVVIKN